MSYSQIFRRINRMVKGEIEDLFERMTAKDREELDDFDAELAGRKKTTDSGESRRTTSSSGTSSSGTTSSGTSSSTGGSGARSRQGAAGARQSGGGQSGGGQSGGGQTGGQTGEGRRRHDEAQRKPGERDDAYYYAVLGLPVTASVDEIRRSYRKLMSQYHPDRVATLDADSQRRATEKAKAINEAYQIIERRRGFK
jgi:cobalamin biosynthesis Mg chelatase CobN